MQMITTLFLQVAKMSVTAGIVAVLVMLVRVAVLRMPKSYSYVLWGLVAFRLVCPVAAECGWSIFNTRISRMYDNQQNFEHLLPEEMNAGNEIIGLEQEALHTGFAFLTDEPSDHTISKGEYDTGKIQPVSVDSRHGRKKYDIYLHAASIVWLAGMTAFVLCYFAGYSKMKRRVSHAVLLQDNVYECDKIGSPFVLGIITPKIYIPFRLEKEIRDCILLHEKFHVRRKDYLVKSIAYFLASVHWFNPLIWVSYRLMSSDMEMSCDEQVISRLGNDKKKMYSQLLLAFAANRRLPESPLAFGECNASRRIKNVLHYKKPSRLKIVVSAVMVAAVTVACATDAVPQNTDTLQNLPIDTDRNTNNGITAKDDFIHYHDNESEKMQGENDRIVSHQPVQWAENTMFDMEFPELDYADDETIIFHMSFGLFQYSLLEKRIVQSIDLKALGLQKIVSGAACTVTVNESGTAAMLSAFPDKKEVYVYQFEENVLRQFTVSDSVDAIAQEQGITPVFDKIVSKTAIEGLKESHRYGWQAVAFDDGTYGLLHFENAYISTMTYQRGTLHQPLFVSEQATLPRLLKQDDSFYQSLAEYDGQNAAQCILDFAAMYNMHDYAGICALSVGLNYSDALQEEWLSHTDYLGGGPTLSHTDEEIVVRYARWLDKDTNETETNPLDITFRYIEGLGWRAVELEEILQ